MINRIRNWAIRLLARIFDRSNTQPRASDESMVIIGNITRELGERCARIMVAHIYQFPDRQYYQMWYIPDHDEIIGALGIASQAYFSDIASIEAAGLIKKKKDRKTRRLMYAIDFNRLNSYQRRKPRRTMANV